MSLKEYVEINRQTIDICFNPCCNGMSLKAELKFGICFLSGVLILVVMECL